MPEHFGRFRVVGRLGQGGMGSVYVAHDLDLDRRVALKVPRLSYADEPLVERFLREARAVAALEHPERLPVYEVGEVDGVPYLAWRTWKAGRCPTASARGRPCRSARPPNWSANWPSAGDVHGQGVIHRDLKPGNVMFNAQGRPLLVDFGLAVRLTGEDARSRPAAPSSGRRPIVARSKWRGGATRSGPRCDVWRLGVILYELLAGRLPFNGTVGEILFRSRDAGAPRSTRPDLDAALEQVCLKAMAQEGGGPLRRHGRAGRRPEGVPRRAPREAKAATLARGRPGRRDVRRTGAGRGPDVAAH